jgi:ABC-2 type transport system ATP-binding protein
MAAILAQGLTKHYGKNRGIEDVSLTVESGELFGFIGPNGAGKSTMIRTMMGMIFPSGGSVNIFGHDCVRESHIIKRSVGYVPCEVRFYEDLTVRQMLEYSDSFYKTSDAAYTKELAGRFGLEPGKKMGELSSGNKKKTAIVAALTSKPKLLILDEPTSGLDPLMRRTLFEALREQQEKGATVFLSSHNLDEVQSLCERAAIIREGRIADVRTIKNMAAQAGKKITLSGRGLSVTGEEVQVLSGGEDSLAFIYRSGDMEKLRMMLSGLKFTDILVEDEKLSDVFMSYYDDAREGRLS